MRETLGVKPHEVLDILSAFLLAGVRAAGEKTRVVLGGKDTAQPVSRPRGAVTMLPWQLSPQGIPIFPGTKMLLWWRGHVCSWLC